MIASSTATNSTERLIIKTRTAIANSIVPRTTAFVSVTTNFFQSNRTTNPPTQIITTKPTKIFTLTSVTTPFTERSPLPNITKLLEPGVSATKVTTTAQTTRSDTVTIKSTAIRKATATGATTFFPTTSESNKARTQSTPITSQRPTIITLIDAVTQATPSATSGTKSELLAINPTTTIPSAAATTTAPTTTISLSRSKAAGTTAVAVDHLTLVTLPINSEILKPTTTFASALTNTSIVTATSFSGSIAVLPKSMKISLPAISSFKTSEITRIKSSTSATKVVATFTLIARTNTVSTPALARSAFSSTAANTATITDKTIVLTTETVVLKMNTVTQSGGKTAQESPSSRARTSRERLLIKTGTIKINSIGPRTTAIAINIIPTTAVTAPATIKAALRNTTKVSEPRAIITKATITAQTEIFDIVTIKSAATTKATDTGAIVTVPKTSETAKAITQSTPATSQIPAISTITDSITLATSSANSRTKRKSVSVNSRTTKPSTVADRTTTINLSRTVATGDTSILTGDSTATLTINSEIFKPTAIFASSSTKIAPLTAISVSGSTSILPKSRRFSLATVSSFKSLKITRIKSSASDVKVIGSSILTTIINPVETPVLTTTLKFSRRTTILPTRATIKDTTNFLSTSIVIRETNTIAQTTTRTAEEGASLAPTTSREALLTKTVTTATKSIASRITEVVTTSKNFVPIDTATTPTLHIAFPATAKPFSMASGTASSTTKVFSESAKRFPDALTTVKKATNFSITLTLPILSKILQTLSPVTIKTTTSIQASPTSIAASDTPVKFPNTTQISVIIPKPSMRIGTKTLAPVPTDSTRPLLTARGYLKTTQTTTSNKLAYPATCIATLLMKTITATKTITKTITVSATTGITSTKATTNTPATSAKAQTILLFPEITSTNVATITKSN